VTKKLTKTAIAQDLAKRIDAHLKRFEQSPKINAVRKEGTRSYYNAYAIGDRHRVFVKYVHYQGGSHLSIEDATKYLAWLDAGNVGRHYEALRK